MKIYNQPTVEINDVQAIHMLMDSPGGNIQGDPNDKGMNNPTMAPTRPF